MVGLPPRLVGLAVLNAYPIDERWLPPCSSPGPGKLGSSRLRTAERRRSENDGLEERAELREGWRDKLAAFVLAAAASDAPDDLGEGDWIGTSADGILQTRCSDVEGG